MFVELNYTYIPKEIVKQFESMTQNNLSVFVWEDTSLGRTSVTKHKINTREAYPIVQHPRRIPAQFHKELNKMIENMFKENVIRPSDSPWASPIVLVKKKMGGLRLCIDYRKPNKVTCKDSFLLPQIDDTLDALSGSKWFTTLDLASEYWQVEMDEEDIEKNGLLYTEWPIRVSNNALWTSKRSYYFSTINAHRFEESDTEKMSSLHG